MQEAAGAAVVRVAVAVREVGEMGAVQEVGAEATEAEATDLGATDSAAAARASEVEVMASGAADTAVEVTV